MVNTRHGAIALLLVLASCGGGGEGEGQGKGPPGGAPPPTPVGYVTVREQPVTLTTELPGRTAPFETSDVRPQVNGIVLARLFTEGDVVRAGQPLYRIDPAPYQAAVASARAALQRSQSQIGATAALSRRYGELVRINAISRQEYDNAVAGASQARADVAAQQAALRSAQIDLGRTTIRAPITGRIGRSVYTTGALVTAAQTEPLTTIQRLDPIYVDIQQSSADLLKLREQVLAGNVSRSGGARVRIKLESGSTYPQEGTLRFADVTVDPATGSQTIRALVPNQQGLLLPGMFVRAELVEGVQGRALLVPQRAVSRDERGRPTVLVVGQGNKAEPRMLTTNRTQGTDWIVTGGLRPGDRVIVEGAMMLRPGMVVNPSPFGQRPAAPPQGGRQAQPQAQAK
ncbi:membrane fusion protein, multidrug efflux system [Sphingomonas guangdongensis]|uniref:Membrane fusion protein, multidrug efflux system n=1 Tax=Sphingomonas guangdongensis TaxID=1141890 RepID=A0A285R4M5_9SPHN|nr:efflux RND transporter periplasmic adaptor subunit [Sphingomonas guangdongensis]SOB87302.1 membrane fusion protein, multidrug efflux system [Sphingomonas guangdongensis]